jgi:diguanylate cyclase (GGDEF)-like protein
MALAGQRVRPLAHAAFWMALLRAAWGLLLLALLHVGIASAQPAAPTAPVVIELGEQTRGPIDLWPAARVLLDPTHTLDAAAAWRQRDAFRTPEVPHSNFGIERASLWLQVPLEVAQGAERWVLDIAYPPLNDIDVYLVRNGAIQPLGRLGSKVDVDQRPVPARTHALPHQFDAGPQDLLLRVRTSSSMVVPITLSRPAMFYLSGARVQLVQGLAFGVVCVLVLYGLVQWFALRDPAYGLYALGVSASSLFLLAYTGLGPQLIWAHYRGGVIDKIAPLAALLALAAGSIFVARTLNTRLTTPTTDRGLRFLCLCATTSFTLSVLGLLDYRATQLAATTLGPPVLLLALPVAFVHARRGDPIGTYMFISWSCYAVGALLLAGLLRGVLPATFWTIHAYQIGHLIEMLVWLRVLALRTRELTLQAQSALRVRHQLESQARTDPLTGLVNRRGLELALPTALRVRSGQKDVAGAAGALLVLDLDGFKPVNDSHGHAVGDLVLQTIARRLQSGVRTGDLVARLGGDEFVVFATGPMDAARTQALGEQLIRLISEPIDADQRRCTVGATVGYALAQERDADNVSALLVRADQAMYDGKRSGRGVVREHASVDAAAPTDHT